MSTEEQDSWEKDPVWKLVDQAPAPQARPAFAQDVLRQVRQLEAEPATPWWKKLLAPAPLSAGALAAAAVVAILISVDFTPTGAPSLTNGGEVPDTAPVLSEIDHAVSEQLLMAAAEDPDLFSDEELLAMLY